MFKINEIFQSIQGEGRNAGLHCNFIRFSGCNLSCSFCDSDHDKFDCFENTREIINRLNKNILPVIITGGEPCVHKDEILKLIPVLRDNKHNIFIETNGSIFNSDKIFERIQWLTVSPKYIDNKFFVTKEALHYCDELKIVITKDFCNGDNLTLKDEIRSKIYDLFLSCNENTYKRKYFYFQPEFFNLELTSALIKNIIMNDPLFYDVRVSLQLHKILGIK